VAKNRHGKRSINKRGTFKQESRGRPVPLGNKALRNKREILMLTGGDAYGLRQTGS
jgi:hypothetical protein